uniref:Endosialidase chaperone n=1 Tax=Siphoviridae sp. ct0uL16 TaxID=2825299 RepID=A0A8S5Q4G4_9CAUD|nr:MAG TPA: endosialidase chaperone [Siphoviridae sp. ct0uL16]
MRAKTTLWTEIAKNGRFSMDVKAEIGSVSYTAISAPNIEQLLMSDAMKVGNCATASLKFSVMTKNAIEKGAKVVIKARITNDGTTFSEWKEFGTFYISKRQANNGLVTLECYDSMIKAQQNYVDSSNADDRIGWPKTQKACTEEIAQRIGVEIDSRTTVKTGDAYQVAYPTNYTMAQVLGFIGACNGGNWIITPENKLRLVPLVSPPSDSDSASTNSAGGGKIDVPVVIDKITTGKNVSISRITATRDEQLGYSNGNDTGAELKIENNPYVNQTVCDDLYATFNGVVYSPFTASKTCFDPCAELGDWVIIGNQVRSVLYKQSLTFGIDFRANIEAPGKDETEDEYPYLTEIQKLQRRDEELKKYTDEAKNEIDSKIEQTRTSILLEVGGTYATQESVNASLKFNADAITAEVKRAKDQESSLSSRIQQNVDSILLRVTKTELSGEVSSQIEQKADSIRLKASKISWQASKSSMTEDGVLTAQGADIKGIITATKLVLDGCKISSDDIDGLPTMPDTSLFISVDGAITEVTDEETIKQIQAGTYTGSSPYFSVSNKGLLVAANAVVKGKIYATEGEFTGKVTANSGSIGGLTIEKDCLYRVNNSGTHTFYLNQAESKTISISAFSGLKTRFYLGYGSKHYNCIFASEQQENGENKDWLYIYGDKLIISAPIDCYNSISASSFYGQVYTTKDGTSLQTQINGKADAGHTHSNYALTTHTHSGYAASSHTHSIANITNLQTTLDGKASKSHAHSGYALLTGATFTGVVQSSYFRAGNAYVESKSGATISDAGNACFGQTVKCKALTQTSDRRLKNTIAELDHSFDEFFRKLKPVTFKFNDKKEFSFGFIAQDVKKALAESGHDTEQFDIVQKGEAIYYSINHTQITALNTHMIQIALNENAELKKRVSQLEEKILKLTA